MKKPLNEYEQQAVDFAEANDVTMKAIYLGHFPRLGEHAVANYQITLGRKNTEPFTFTYSDSIHNSWKHTTDGRHFPLKQGLPPLNTDFWPKIGEDHRIGHYGLKIVKDKVSMYDILACLTKYDPDTFDNFCGDFGYDEDSRKAFDVYLAVQKEWTEVHRLFGDVMDELCEIQ